MKNNNKTAVEWLAETLRFASKELYAEMYETIEEAKEMEKEQHSITWDDSRVEDKGDNYVGKQKSFNDYYNETYGGNK
jgi:hypothetical protein